MPSPAADPDWGSCDDPLHLAAVPHAGRGRRRRARGRRRRRWRSPARTSSTSTTRTSPPARPTATARPPRLRSSSNDSSLRTWLGVLVIVVPGIIGLFWGAPLVARELEAGTFRLAWTQSVTRTRWLAVEARRRRPGVSMAVAGLLSLMVTWWASPPEPADHPRHPGEHRSDHARRYRGVRDVRGISLPGAWVYSVKIATRLAPPTTSFSPPAGQRRPAESRTAPPGSPPSSTS